MSAFTEKNTNTAIPPESDGMVRPLTDNDPIVAFDARLGERYEFMDFDYDAFAEKAASSGLAPSGIGGLKVQINDGPMFYQIRGHYNPVDKRMVVRAGRRADKTLAHELQHAADDINGTPSDLRRLKIGIAANKTMHGAMLPEVIDVTKVGHIPEAVIHGSAVAVAASLAVFAWGYHQHPAEKRARAAEKTVPNKIITMQKKKLF